MAIGYKKKHQKMWKNGKVEETFVAKVEYGSYIDDDTLATEITKICTASEADVSLVLRALEDRISFHITHGNVVKLETLGSFYPTIKARAVSDPDLVDKKSIDNKGVRFEPSARFSKKLKKTPLRLVDDQVFESETHPRTKVVKEK